MISILASAFSLLTAIAFAQIYLYFQARTDFYVFNKGKDTIRFGKLDFRIGFNHSDIRPADLVQVDGAGKLEVIFFREVSRNCSNHGGSFDAVESKKLSKYEIWNIDTKTLLFNAIFDWNHYKSHFDARVELASQRIDQQYRYDFAMDRNGVVAIKNHSGTDGVKPDKPTGTYRFIDGKFIRIFE